MSFFHLARCTAFIFVALTGCGIVGARKELMPKWPLMADRAPAGMKELAMAGSGRDPVLPDPSTMIPPPPRMDLVPEISPAPAEG